MVTTLARSVPVLENNLMRYGLDRRCARVRATDVPVLELDNPASNARARIGAEIARALEEDGAEAIVLGCAGMADLAASLSAEFSVPVIDGVAAAVVLAEGLAAIGLKTSKRGGFARPIAKDLFRVVRALLAEAVTARSERATMPCRETWMEAEARQRSRSSNCAPAMARRSWSNGVDLSVAPGEFVAILGSSGCGKTTLLRTIAGFQKASAGRVRSFGHDMTDLPPERRDVAMVFQSYALWPHMTVLGNIGYGLRLRGMPREEIRTRVGTILAMLNMSGLEDRKVTDLSGGQRQRVALGRALAVEPRLLLLDEPLSNLDAKVRLQLRGEIKALQGRLGFAALHVTHDREEAMTMADRIVVMDQGRIAQVGTPEEVYHRPNSPFVATFMGADNTIALTIGAGACGQARRGRRASRRDAGRGRDRRTGPAIAYFRDDVARIEKPGAPGRRRDRAAGQGHAAVISGWSLPLRGGGRGPANSWSRDARLFEVGTPVGLCLPVARAASVSGQRNRKPN